MISHPKTVMIESELFMLVVRIIHSENILTATALFFYYLCKTLLGCNNIIPKKHHHIT